MSYQQTSASDSERSPPLPARWVEEASAFLQGTGNGSRAAAAAGAAVPDGPGGSGPGSQLHPQGLAQTAAEQWRLVLERHPDAPAAMGDVLAMTGIEEVKLTLVRQYHRIALSRRQDDGPSHSYNARLEGSSGTGKTTVARHYAAFLRQLGVLPNASAFVEMSGALLAQYGIPQVGARLRGERLKEAE